MSSYLGLQSFYSLSIFRYAKQQVSETEWVLFSGEGVGDKYSS
jgi:hypothetical protein